MAKADADVIASEHDYKRKSELFAVKAVAQADRAGQIIRRLRQFVEKRETERRDRRGNHEQAQEPASAFGVEAKIGPSEQSRPGPRRNLAVAPRKP